VYLHGPLITDTIASWIDEKFVAGPFSTPPFSNFRQNAIIAVEQTDKIRPVLNLSDPAGLSYNDAIDKTALPKAQMSSAQSFSHALWLAGRFAVFSKFDMHAAYINIPQRPSLGPAQGFQWLGKFFVDTTTVFGSSAAVIQFDTFAHTLQNLALHYAPIPSFFIHRVLDDLPVISPPYLPLCENFTAAYLAIADQCNIILAPPCPRKEKAFYNSTSGLVLGIWFDSRHLTWSLPTTKIQIIRHRRCCTHPKPRTSTRFTWLFYLFLQTFSFFPSFSKPLAIFPQRIR
jgi:hypothetical protein